MDSLITLTPKAINKIKELQDSLKLDNSHFIRVGAKGGKGCMGVQPFIAFDHKQDSDLLNNIQGVEIIIDKTQTMHLIGLQVDYYEDTLSKGFVFETPDKP